MIHNIQALIVVFQLWIHHDIHKIHIHLFNAGIGTEMIPPAEKHLLFYSIFDSFLYNYIIYYSYTKMFSKILKPQKMIQSLEIKYLTKNKPNTTSQKMSQSLETKYSPKTLKLNISSQRMSQSFEIKYLSKNKPNNC